MKTTLVTLATALFLATLSGCVGDAFDDDGDDSEKEEAPRQEEVAPRPVPAAGTRSMSVIRNLS